MKHLLIGLLCLQSLLAPCISSAQKAEPIYSFVAVEQSLDWYKQQQKAWKKELDKNRKNAYAWYNYYRVSRNLNILDSTDTRSRQEKWETMQYLVKQMGKAVPSSFEYNLCKWMSGGNQPENLPYLKKAEELGQNRSEHWPDMLVWGETERDLKKKEDYARRWYQSNEVSPGMLSYNYNVLLGLRENAILVTAGDNDTYPAWLLQSQGIRKDVTVLNLSLLMLDHYREKIFAELGISAYTFDKSNPQEHFEKNIIAQIAANNKKHPVYVALTVDPRYTGNIEDKLYLTGLAYEYSAERFDNMAILKKNFEQVYGMDYAEKHFYKDRSEPIVRRLNCNYIVPLIKLFEHYKLAGETAKAERTKQMVTSICQYTDMEKETLKYFLTE